jgi:hypothetical protein
MAEATSTSEPTPIVAILRRRLDQAIEYLEKPNLSRDALALWIGGVRFHLERFTAKARYT